MESEASRQARRIRSAIKRGIAAMIFIAIILIAQLYAALNQQP